MERIALLVPDPKAGRLDSLGPPLRLKFVSFGKQRRPLRDAVLPSCLL